MKDCCSLSEHHRLSLIRDRKISLERIEQDYFTCPTNWRQKDTIIARIKEKYPAYTDEILMNIPGFFYDKKRGKLSFTGHKGLGILIRNSDSRIVAVQIRKDRFRKVIPDTFGFPLHLPHTIQTNITVVMAVAAPKTYVILKC